MSRPIETSTLQPEKQRNEDLERAQPFSSSLATVLDKIENDDSQHANHAPLTPDQHSPGNEVPKLPNESLSDPLFPPSRTHYAGEAKVVYRLVSAILSFLFLCVVMVFAMVKTLPSIAWVVWSWLQFKDPNRFRPFYEQEKRRKNLDPGKLKCDIGYYAHREGLDCDETKIDTEDGFILTVQHILDRRQGAPDWKREKVVDGWAN